MTQISNWQLAEQIIGRWHPSDITFISEIHYIGGVDSENGKITLNCIANRRDIAKNCWPDYSNPFFEIILCCKGVTALTIKNFGARYAQITGFDITDTANLQWEGSRYLIEDYEAGKIHILCNEIAILNVKKIILD